ncbi:MAG: transposase [Acidobacteriota bacterium]
MFVTWRLAGSLPHLRWTKRHDERARHAFAALDRQADRATGGSLWLKDPRVVSLAVETLLAGESERGFYEIRAWVVMPNHVHCLLRPFRDLAVITRWLKGSTARRANLLLGRTGQPFWQGESWDHWVRNDEELQKLTRYIKRNPVSAGLAATPEDWPWSSASLAGETACPTLVYT